VDVWLTQARDAIASVTGASANELLLDDQAEGTLLELARIAAHESGSRTNAPLLCYLVGRAEGRVDLETLARVVRNASAERRPEPGP
jgi:hypothetical protein